MVPIVFLKIEESYFRLILEFNQNYFPVFADALSFIVHCMHYAQRIVSNLF